MLMLSIAITAMNAIVSLDIETYYSTVEPLKISVYFRCIVQRTTYVKIMWKLSGIFNKIFSHMQVTHTRKG